METGKLFLRLANGVTQTHSVTVTETVEDGVHALFLDGTSDQPLDAQFGAGIELSVDGMQRWMADYRHSEYWCRPAFGTVFSQVPEETQGLIYEKSDGSFGVILPVVSEQYKCVLTGLRADTVLAKLFSWYPELTACKGLAVLWAEGENPYTLLEKCAQVGLRLLGTGCRTRKERGYPELFDYLGWCSWDAFEIRVDEEGLLAKCREFQEKDIPVKWVILDDMWAEVHDFYGARYENRQEMFDLMHGARLYAFRADPYRFPRGLKACIAEINDYGITAGMWHPTTGYWKGIDPQGDAYRELVDCLIQTEDGTYVPSPDREKAYRYYGRLHDYLQQSGAAFVKIDNQSMSRRFYQNLAPVGQVARQFHDAMEASAAQHFDNQMINCMGMASEDMWNRRVSPISRCSDDFLPENPEWFTKHILQCAYNSLIQGQFYTCDWDMWWTDDGQAVKNSILRAISGGPIYVSDPLGRSRAEIIKPLILKDGRILRCDRPAMPSRDCLTVDPVHSSTLFKLQNLCNGSGILAAFHLDVSGGPVTGTVSPMDVEGLEGREFAVYEHFSGAFRVMKPTEALELTLQDSNDYKLYVLVPLRNGCAMIGRTDKFLSPATLRSGSDGKPELVEAGPWACVKDRQLYRMAQTDIP